MTISSLLQTLTTTKRFDIDDTPQYWRKVCEDPNEFATWSEVEWALNNPQFFDIQLVNRETNVYHEMMIYERCWSRPSFDVKDIMDGVADGHNIIINNFGWVNRQKQEILHQFENHFPGARCELHIYAGIAPTKSFKIHEDFANNFILQVEGETRWKVYKNRRSMVWEQIQYDLDENDLEVAIDVVMQPGDMLFIPQGCYHWAQPQSKRLSCSIPLWTNTPHLKKFDRKYYALPR